MPSPTAVEIVLSAEERAQLESWERRRTSAQALAERSRVVLAAAEGLKNAEIAERLGVHRGTVTKWRNRFAERRLDGLSDEPRPGQPRKITDQKIEEVITKTLGSAPKDATHWSTRSMAQEVGVVADRDLSDLAGVRASTPPSGRVEAVSGPWFIEKVRDVVGLYMNPPERAVVLCVDEKVRHEALSDSSGVKDPDAGPPQRPGGS